jgi:phage tail sheath gpL-like
VNGATNPSVTAALAQVGDVWETMFLNCLDVADTTTLAEYAAFGEGRWGALVHKPCIFFTGNTATTVANAIAVPDARKTDRTNGQFVAPASNDLPFVVAARQLARVLKVANNNPPTAYGGQKATGLVPGADGSQWLYTQRDTAIKGGSSTISVVDSIVTLEDIVTFYHPTGDPLPAYQYAVDIVKIQNILYNIDLIFSEASWKSAPLLPDDQATTNPNARKPKDAKAALASLVDSLGLEAIISDPATAKDSIVAVINSTNPKRLDMALTVALSGNTKIKSVDLFFGFFFGTAPTV